MMTRGALFRIIAVAAVALVTAIVIDRDDEAPFSVTSAVGRVGVQTPKPQAVPAATRPGPEPGSAPDDPFAPRGWQAPTVAPSAAPIIAPAPVLAPAAPLPVEAPVAPSLPYAFMGQFDDGGRQVVYLSRNDQTFVVTAGETLEGTYKVLAMQPRQIEFEHMPTGTKQVLTIPAPNN